ncbi:uncharacterized protein LOC131046166 [Cryptomeria japonica]|uniref:uncharacterized protein LOC131046166 n=1 Tax=Cryptomeria japonica TaxID=3369 RepID=UPI0025AC6BC5|nr:uncharacterized protein LOC131046166 [Cryptomeria japonica]
MSCVCDAARVSSAVPADSDATVVGNRSSPSLTAKGNKIPADAVAAVDARSSPSSTANENVLSRSHARTSPTTKGDKVVRASSGATARGKCPSVVLANASRDANAAKKMPSSELRPVLVSNPISITLDEDIEMEIDHNSSIFSKHALICRFKGIWPSLPELHDWILQHWEPLLAGTIQDFRC